MRGVEAVVICSVVPPLNDCFSELSRNALGVEPCFVEPEEQSLMPIRYFQPADVGADRIVNAIAVRELYGVPAIIVDFGTATTFDAVSPEGEYLGGIIAPGIGISSEALFSRAAKLPRIEIKRPEHGIGRSTVESMQSGIFYGYVGLVDGILKRMERELKGANITATGGLARLIATEFDGFDRIEDNLTLYGLRIFYERTQRS
jgi:type III pantothenate kinase